MTRKLKVGSFVSLDGVIENPAKIAGSCFDEEVKEYSFEALADVEYGITNLDRTLLAAGLVDEYQIRVIPKVVGEGKRAFEDVDHELVGLKLVDTHRFKNGVMVLTYVPQ